MKHRDDFALWVQYKKARNEFCSTVRIAKKLAMKSFSEDASNMDGILRVSRAISQQRPPQVGHFRKKDGTYTSTRGEVLDSLMDEFFPDSTEYEEAQAYPDIYVTKHEITDLFSLRN